MSASLYLNVVIVASLEELKTKQLMNKNLINGDIEVLTEKIYKVEKEDQILKEVSQPVVIRKS